MKIPDDQQDRGTKILIDDLLAKPLCWAREDLLSRVRRHKYHDFKSDDALNSITLVKHLKAAGYHDLAQNAADGKYDQQSDAIREWEQTPEGKETIAMAERDPELRAKLDTIMQAAQGMRVIIPNDGPPEPGSKGEA